MRSLAWPLAMLMTLAIHARADECVDAYEAGQRAFKLDAHYAEARKQLAVCNRESCPALVAKECTDLLVELEQAQPSVLIAARDERGEDVADVQVVVDGTLVRSHLDGKPLLIEPGEHALRFVLPNHPPVEQQVVVRVGEKLREIHVDFRPLQVVQPPPRTETHWLGVPVSAIVVGSVGVLSLGAWAVLGLTGLAQEQHLSGTCINACNPSQVSALELQYNFADVALGVGAVAVIVAVVLTATHRGPVVLRPAVSGRGAAVFFVF